MRKGMVILPIVVVAAVAAAPRPGVNVANL